MSKKMIFKKMSSKITSLKAKQAITYKILLSLCVLMVFSGFARAESSAGQTLVASIRPLAFILNELALPTDKVIQLVSNNNSAHHYQLKVSDRRLLESADLVVWVGPELEIFLEKPLQQVSRADAQAGKSKIVSLIDTPDIDWPKTTAQNQTQKNGDSHYKDEHKADHSKQAHDESSHKEHSNDNHAQESKDHDDHNHDGLDAHIWLNPKNVQAMVSLLARRLGQLSPDNAAAYQLKAQTLIQALTKLDETIAKQLAGVVNKPFIVLHPAYSHFITRYQLSQLDYVVINPERNIGAKHLYELSQQKMVCVFGEVGQANKHIDKIAKAAKAKVGQLDPLGSNLEDTASITDLIRNLADDFHVCLG
jgi:zinc transport system substrate-binding protein